MKHKIVVLTLLLMVVLATVAFASGEPSGVRQVAYELQIFELSRSDAQIMGIWFPEPEDLLDLGAKSITRLVHSPGLIQILRTGASLFQVAASHERDQQVRLAQPRLTVALGETGKFALSTEEWISDQLQQTFSPYHYGLKMLLTPVRVDSGGEQIFTTVELSTSAMQNQELLTSVWTKAGDLEPIGVLSYEELCCETTILKEQEKSQIRYFAVYLRAQAIAQLSSEPSVQIGSLGGLTDLLWPGEPQLEPSMIQVSMPVKPLAMPEIELNWWLSKGVKVGFSTATEARYALEVGLAMFDQELLLTGQVVGGESQTYMALGLTDRVVVHPSMTLSAGFYPLVLGLREQKLSRPSWWVQMEVAENKVYGSLKYSEEVEYKTWEGNLGYQWAPKDLVLLRYKTDLKDQHRLFLGYQRKF